MKLTPILLELLNIFLFLSCSNAAVSEGLKSSSEKFLQVREDTLTHEHIRLMEEVNVATHELLEQLSVIPRMTIMQFEQMAEALVTLLCHTRILKLGELNLLFAVLALDEASYTLCAILQDLGISSDSSSNPNGQFPAELTFDAELISSAIQRSQWYHHQVLSSGVPDIFHQWAQVMYLLQTSLIGQMKQPSSYYYGIITTPSTLLNLRGTTAKIVGRVESVEKYGTWKKHLDFVMEKYFEPVRQICMEWRFPKDVDHELLFRLAKCGVTFYHIGCNLDLTLKTREAIFMSYSQKVSSVSEYMSGRRAFASIPFVDARPFNVLSPTAIGMQLLSGLLLQFESNLKEFWNHHNDEESRVGLSQLFFSLCLFRDLLLVGKTPMLSGSTASFSSTQLIQAVLFQIIPAANASLFELSKSLLSDVLCKTMESILLVPKNSKSETNLKASVLETAYSILEAEFAMLLKKDSDRAVMMYRFLEICRGVVALEITTSALISKDMGNFSLPQQRTVSLVVLEECHGYWKSCLPKMTFQNMKFSKMTQQVTKIVTVFSNALIRHIIPSGLEVELYVHLDKRIRANENSPFWIPLQGKIRQNMLKPRPIPVEFKAGSPKSNLKFKPTSYQNTIPPTDRLGSINNVLLKENRNASKKTTNAKSIPSENEAISNSLIAVASAIPATPGMKSDYKEEALLEDGHEDNTENEKVTQNSLVVAPSKHLSGPLMCKQARDVGSAEPKRTVWDDALTKLLPTFSHQFIMSQIKLERPREIANKHIEKYEDPTHFAAIAGQVGYVAGSVDPRDFLMAIILIGERIMAKKIQPLLAMFQQNRSTDYLFDMFYQSIESFENETRMLNELDPGILKPALTEAGLNTAHNLLILVKFYRMRCSVCHPYVPKSASAKKSIAARHLTALDTLHALNSDMTMRMRHYLESYEEIFVLPIETGFRRPRNLFSPQCTDKALAFIGLFELLPLDDIRISRNIAAHKSGHDEIYASYIQYVFRNSPDFELLMTL